MSTCRIQMTFLCMADKDSKRRIPFAYLNDIKARFEEMYGATIKTAVEMNMNEEFSKVMEKRMVLDSMFTLFTRSSLTTILLPTQLLTFVDRSKR